MDSRKWKWEKLLLFPNILYKQDWQRKRREAQSGQIEKYHNSLIKRFFDKKDTYTYNWCMTNTPKDVLNSVNNELKQHIDLIEQPSTRGFISKQEYDTIVSNAWHKKHVDESNMRISLTKEALLSTHFKTCVPIIIQDQLNWYAALWHYSQSFVWSFSQNSDLWHNLELLAPWSLVIKILYLPHSCNPNDVENEILKHRSDVISIEHIQLPDNDRSYFDVLYTPRSWEIFIPSIWYEDKVYKIDGLNRWVWDKVPDYEVLRWYFAQNIANTFFL